MAVDQHFGATARVGQPAGQDNACDLCGGGQFDLIGQFDRRGDVLHTGICLRCGLVRHMSIPTDEELAAYYGHTYRQDYHGEVSPSARRVMRAWNNGQRIYRQLAPCVPANAKVFEIGAGIGCTIKAFALHGHDATGIDPGEGFQRFSAEQLKTRLEKADLFDLPSSPRCDLAVLVHVIEHFRSPRQALEKIHALVVPGGLLYVECPNLLAPFATRSRLFHYAHVHNFTPSSLSMMALRCGFSPLRVFSSDDDPNLQVLFRREASGVLQIDTENRHRTLVALDKYNLLTYHLRWRYLARRASKVAGYLKERLFAKRELARITTLCREAEADRAARQAADLPEAEAA